MTADVAAATEPTTHQPGSADVGKRVSGVKDKDTRRNRARSSEARVAPSPLSVLILRDHGAPWRNAHFPLATLATASIRGAAWGFFTVRRCAGQRLVTEPR